MGYLIVFAGAGLGGALRHGVNLATDDALRARVTKLAEAYPLYDALEQW